MQSNVVQVVEAGSVAPIQQADLTVHVGNGGAVCQTGEDGKCNTLSVCIGGACIAPNANYDASFQIDTDTAYRITASATVLYKSGTLICEDTYAGVTDYTSSTAAQQTAYISLALTGHRCF